MSGELLKLATHKIAAWKSRKVATGNDVIGYFQSATNSINATGTTANFSIRKYFLSVVSENARASNFKIYHNVAHDSLYILTGNDVAVYFWSAANRTNMSILGHVQIAISL